MAQYTPKTWTTGETITAAELNAIEAAAAAAAVKADADAAYDAKGAATTAQAAATAAAAADATTKANAAQAAAVQRATHTGTQAASTITGLASVATSGAYADLSGKPVVAVAATVSASGALASNAHTPVDATSGARTMALPTGSTGDVVSVEKEDATTNAVTVTGSIRGGASSISLVWQNESIVLRRDAAGSWWPYAGHKTKTALDAAYAGQVTDAAVAAQVTSGATTAAALKAAYVAPNAGNGTSPLAAQPFIRVENFGAKCDGIAGYQGVAVSGSPTFTDPTAAFTTALVGKTFSMKIGGSLWGGTIAAVPSATTLTISTNAPASSTVTGTGASITAGSSHFTLASGMAAYFRGGFLTITGAGASGADLTAQVLAIDTARTGGFLVATTAQGTAVNAGTTVSSANWSLNNGMYSIGTDDTAAWQAAVAAAQAAAQTTGRAPVITWLGVSLTSGFSIGYGITLRGAGQSNAQPGNAWPTQGSILRSFLGSGGTTRSYVLRLGASGGDSYIESGIGARVEDCTIDGALFAIDAVQTAGNLGVLSQVTVRNGTQHAVNLGGWQTQLLNCSIAQPGFGVGLYVNESDTQVVGGFIKSGQYQIEIASNGDFSAIGVHLWNSWAPYGAGTTNSNVHIIGGANANFTGCEFDNTFGPQVLVAAAAGVSISHVHFNACSFFQFPEPWQVLPDNTYPIFLLDANAAGASISDVSINGCNGWGLDATHRTNAYVQFNLGSIFDVRVSDCRQRNCAALYTGTAPSSFTLRGVDVYDDGTSTWRSSPAELAQTGSGNGSTTAFAIPHRLGVTPRSFQVVPASAAAAAPFYVTADATNVTVTYLTAPAAGTNNLTWQMRAAA